MAPASSAARKSPVFGPKPTGSQRRTIGAAILVMGLTALLLQVLLTRELLVSFFGNELCIGLILVDWLLLMAAGTALAGRLLNRLGNLQAALVADQLLIAVLLPFQIYAARSVGGRTMFPGELIDPLSVLGLGALVLAPGCLLLGAQFAFGCQLVAGEDSARAAANVGYIYVLEAVGAIIGGLLFHFCLADHLQTVRIILLLSALNGLAAMLVAVGLLVRRRRLAVICLSIFVIMTVVCALSPIADSLERFTSMQRWPGYRLVTSRNTRYGNVAITEHNSQISVFHDGLLMFTSEDNLDNEELANLVLLQHPGPERVLIMGGGLGGLIGEVLKHHPRVVDYVELDRQAIKVIQRHLPNRLSRPLSDKRVSLIYADALTFLRTTDRQYDVIISNVGDPRTAVINRFYTRQAFQEAAGHLTRQGIFCVSLSYPQTHLSGPRRLLHASVWEALRQTYPQRLPLPDGRIYYLAAKQSNLLTTDAHLLTSRMVQRHIQTKYISPYFIHTVMVPFARQLLMQSLATVSQTPPNDDFCPVTYHYLLRLWLERFGGGALNIQLSFRSVLAVIVALMALCGLAGLYMWGRRDKPIWRWGIVGAIAATGVVEMSMELVVIFSFQVIAGSLFYQLGILIALYMGGLAAGGHLGRYMTTNKRRAAIILCATLVGLALSAALMPAVLLWLSGHRELASVVLGTAAAILGILGGLHFPTGVAVFALPGQPAQAGATLYASDLAGASVGALLVSTIIIPVAGLLQTCFLVSLISLAGLFLALPTLARHKQ